MRRTVINECKVKFPALSRNESLSRSAAAAFAMQCDPTVGEISAIKTSVSEAVTNAIVHGYRDMNGMVELVMRLYSDSTVYIQVKDKGRGIPDIKRAMQPRLHHRARRRGALRAGLYGNGELYGLRARAFGGEPRHGRYNGKKLTGKHNDER